MAAFATMSPAISNFLLSTVKQEETKAEKDKQGRAKCLIKAADLAKVINSHFVQLCQTSMENPYHVNLFLAREFLKEVASHTIRLNSTVVMQACDLAKISARTSKPVDSVIKTLWGKFTDRIRNRSSPTWDNFHEVEAEVGRAWEKLKTQDPFNPAPEDAPPGQDAAGSASGTVPPVKVEPKQELKEEPGVEAVEPEGDMLVVSTDAFAMTALLHHGKMEQAPLHSGPGGVYWVTSSNGQSLATTLSAMAPAPSPHALEDAAPPQQDTVMETVQDTAMEDAAPGLEGENELHEAMAESEGAGVCSNAGCTWCAGL